MLRTKQRSRRQISDLKMDLEVINPIESKKVLGGEWYDTWDCGWIDEVVICVGSGWASGAGTFGGTYDPFYDGSYTSDWYNYDENYGGSGGYGYGDGNGGYGLPNLPSTVEQQLGRMGACVNYAMAFMSSYLGHPMTGGMMTAHNANALNIGLYTASFEGLTPAEATQAIQSYFNTTTLTTTEQIINAVQTNQHGVLANVYVTDNEGKNIPNVAHEVVIVDYDSSTGLFLTADSSSGTGNAYAYTSNGYAYYYQHQINFGNGVYEITGVKP